MASCYNLVKQVGKGASGTANLIEDEQGDRYIMKSMSIDDLNEKQLKNAINEIKVLHELRHPFIVKYRESFVEDKQLHIVMNFCGGGDLHNLIRRQHVEVKKRFKEEAVVRWLAQALLALTDMHIRHIIHRDIKPMNIFLDEDNRRLRLGDFGISTILDNTLDSAHSFVGTPHYLSPELIRDHASKGYGSAVDIWALGCVVHELCTFKTPFHHAKDLPQLLNILRDTNTKVPRIPGGYYSDELRDLCSSMLQLQPAKRPKARDALKYPIIQESIVCMVNDMDRLAKSENNGRRRLMNVAPPVKPIPISPSGSFSTIASSQGTNSLPSSVKSDADIYTHVLTSSLESAAAAAAVCPSADLCVPPSSKEKEKKDKKESLRKKSKEVFKEEKKKKERSKEEEAKIKKERKPRDEEERRRRKAEESSQREYYLREEDGAKGNEAEVRRGLE